MKIFRECRFFLTTSQKQMIFDFTIKKKCNLNKIIAIKFDIISYFHSLDKELHYLSLLKKNGEKSIL